MTVKDLYAALGVGDQAGPEELRRAWLRLAVKYHPDRNPGNARAEERFKKISQAYAILGDPAARARYERTRTRPAEPKTETPKPETPKPESPRAEPRPRPAGPRPDEPRPNEPKPEPRPGGPRPDGSRPDGSRPDGPPRAQAAPEESSDWTEILNAFFQTPKGRDTLKELEEELRRAGLKLSSGSLARWLRTRRRSAPEAALAWLERLRTEFSGGLETRQRDSRYDIGYGLALPPEAAARGATVEISYPRDGRAQEIKVSLPAGLKNGARLCLPDQGRLRPDGGRGDLVLTVKSG